MTVCLTLALQYILPDRVVWPSGLRGETTREMVVQAPAVGTINTGFLSGVSTNGFPVWTCLNCSGGGRWSHTSSGLINSLSP